MLANLSLIRSFFFSQDLLISLSQLLKGSNHDKLKFAFKMYDTNADGCITKGELMDIVSSVHELMGRGTHHNRHVSWRDGREVRPNGAQALSSLLPLVVLLCLVVTCHCCLLLFLDLPLPTRIKAADITKSNVICPKLYSIA